MSWLRWFRKWPYTFIFIVSLVTAALTGLSAVILHIPLKDPDGFMGPAYVRLPGLALIFFAVGIVLAAIDRRNLRNLRLLPKAIVNEVRTTWNLRRVLFIVTGLFCFYVCYVGYRNLKSDLPVFRASVHYDKQLAAVDDFLTAGISPGPLLHTILGTDFTAQLLSLVYLAYLPLIPISLGAFLVLVRDLKVGAWFTTALCLNWILGIISYYILPAVGPVYYRPEQFHDLPSTSVTELQDSLFNNRLIFLSDPEFSDKIHGVAAFASLHVSVTFAAALFMERTNQRLWLRTVTWIFFALVTVSTLYFGWHYIADDLVGLLIGWLSVSIGAWVCGCRRRRRKRLRGPYDRFDTIIPAELGDGELTIPESMHSSSPSSEIPPKEEMLDLVGDRGGGPGTPSGGDGPGGPDGSDGGGGNGRP